VKPDDLVRALLEAQDAAARQDLLVPRAHQFYIAVVRLLKEEADRERLRDPNTALRIAAIANEVAGCADVAYCRALAAWATGNVLIHQGEYAECLRLYREAAHFFATEGAEIEQARLISNQAWVLKNLGHYDEGVQAVQTALRILRNHPPSPFLASALNALGVLCRLSGRYDDALAAYAEGRQIYAALGDEVQTARLDINRAYTLKNLDRFSEAIVLLEKARDTLTRHERSLEVARADLNLGMIDTRLGRYDQALAAFDRAEKGFAVLDNAMEAAVVDLHRADLYAEFNLFQDLLQISTSDWQLFQERQMQWHAARATLHRAVAWQRLGDAAQAEQLLTDAQKAFSRVGDPAWVQAVDQQRAALLCRTGEYARALPLAARTAAFFHNRQMPIQAASSSLLAAQCHLVSDRLAEAEMLYREVLTLSETVDVPWLLYRAHHGLGQVAEQRGDLDDAYGHFRQAVETVESLRQRLHVEDFRTGFVEDKLHVYRDAVLLCLKLNREEEAFAYVERAKSGALVDLLVASIGRSPLLGDPADDEVLARLQTLREQLNWHYGKLQGDGGEEQRQQRLPSEGTVWQCVAVLERETVRAWRQLQQRHPLYASLEQLDTARLASIQPSLQEDEALLQYYVAGETIYLFVVHRDGLRACLPLACAPSQVEDTVAALDILLKSASSFGGEYVATTLDSLSRYMLGQLYADLFRPLVPHLQGARRLLIAPDGVLFKVPFHALYDGQEYLLARYEVAYTPSAGALRLCQQNHGRRGPEHDGALVMGYSGERDLQHVSHEVEAVVQAIPGALVFTDEQATLARLQRFARQSTLLHLATHAVFRRDNPLFSALQLAGGDWLRAMDLYTLRLNGALVTLSACETGRHRLLGGDLFGLSRGFFCAGASALVVSLWPASDDSTARLMARLYARLAAGETATSALRGAQLELYGYEEEREGRRVRPYAHPFFWAPFCLLGAPDIRLT
jgi:CHAT domain-containing protein